MTPLKCALRRAADDLRGISDSPDLDAGLLLAFVLGKPRSYLFGHPEDLLPGEVESRFRELVERRAGGEPVAYLTGCKGFWTLDLEVGPNVLVPRPETEILVQAALDLVADDAAAFRIADLGTGSGAVALALASERPALTIVATDASAEALAVARRNAERLGLNNVTFRHGNWFDAFGDDERFHLLVSNPPYVAENDPHLDALAHEPRSALAAGGDGLDALRRIAAGAARHLLPGGRLLLEHGADQGAAVRQLLKQAGFGEVQTHADLATHPRITTGRKGVES